MPVWSLLGECGPQPRALLLRAQKLERSGWVLASVEKERFELCKEHPDLFRRVPSRYVLRRSYNGAPLEVPGETLLEAIELAERLQRRAPKTGSAVPITTGRQVG
jgi:hypothetical protein